MEKNATKTKKKTAGNDPFLKIVKRLFNVPIFQKTSAIMNAEGAAASITYIQSFFRSPIIEIGEFSRVETYILAAWREFRDARAVAFRGKEEARRAFEEQMDEEAKDEDMMEEAHEEALADNEEREMDDDPIAQETCGACYEGEVHGRDHLGAFTETCGECGGTGYCATCGSVLGVDCGDAEPDTPDGEFCSVGCKENPIEEANASRPWRTNNVGNFMAHIDIPETPVPGLTYGASLADGYWISADGGRRWFAGRTRPDLTLVDSIDADDHDAAIRGEITAEEIISAVTGTV